MELESNGTEPVITKVTDWYEKRKCVDAPRWERIWGAARKVRDNHTYEPRVHDEELLSLTYNTLGYCFYKFDAMRGKQDDKAEDRFVKMFNGKLWSVIADTRKKRRFGRLPSGLIAQRTNLYNAALLIWIREAVANLPNGERSIIWRRYWGGQSWSQIATGLGVGKTTARERHNKILQLLKAECDGYFDLLSSIMRNSYDRFFWKRMSN